jgi:hypothetical protein
VLPSRFFELRASSAVSSYQFDCLVASLLDSITAERFAAYCVVPSTAESSFALLRDHLRLLLLSRKRSPSPTAVVAARLCGARLLLLSF